MDRTKTTNEGILLEPNSLSDLLMDADLVNELASLGLEDTLDLWILGFGERINQKRRFASLLQRTAYDFLSQSGIQDEVYYKTKIECASEQYLCSDSIRFLLSMKVSKNNIVYWETLFKDCSLSMEDILNLNDELKESELCAYFISKVRNNEIQVKHWSQLSSASWDNLLPKPTSELFVKWLLSASRNDRDFAICVERLGLNSGQRKTLEEVGLQFGITRERVRQITKRFLSRLPHPSRRILLNPFRIQLRKIFHENGRIMTLEEVGKYLQFNPDPQHYSPLSALEIILSNCGMFKALGYDYDTGIGAPDIKSVIWYSKDIDAGDIQKIRRLASEYVDKDPCYYCLEDLINRIHIETEVPIDFIRASLRTYEMIEQDPSGYLLRIGKSGNLTIPNMALIVLRELGIPAHFTVITENINKRFPGRNLKPNHVHNYLMNPLFRWVDRGTYGLAEWGLPEIRPRENYAAAKETIRKTLSIIGKPATIGEINEYLDTQTDNDQDFVWLSKPNIILCNNSQLFVSVGRGKWALKEWNLPLAPIKDTIPLACDVLAEEEMEWLTSQQLYLEMKSRGWSGPMVALQRALDREIQKRDRRIRKEELHGFNIQMYGLSSSNWNRENALEKLLVE